MRVVIPTLAASVLLSACGGSSSSNSVGASSSSQPAGSQTSGGGSSKLVSTASNSKLGKTVLVDAQGLTLYALSAERNGKFICTGSCLGVWHPLTMQPGTSSTGSVGSLGKIKRPDGTEQVTYKGMPLYTFAQDQKAGDASGQGIKDVGTWNAVATSASKPAASAPAAPSSSGGGGNGY